jgi:lipopolysaccharide transport system permease protein
MGVSDAADNVLVIRAGRMTGQYFRDLWRYRELFYFLAWRDVAVQYKQTAIGVAWALLRPLLSMIIFTIVFGKIARLPSQGAPYPVLVFAGMLPWQFFANGLMASSGSLLINAAMISKVYFPRVVIPASAIIVAFVDFLVSLGVLAGLMIWYQIAPTWRILALPAFVLLASGAAFGGGLWFSALTAKYRDFAYVVPFLVQFGLYLSPVGFVSGVIPTSWRLLYSLNPLVGVIDGFRWVVLGGAFRIYWPGLLLSLVVVVMLVTSGFRYFRAAERSFADVM